SGDFFNMIRPFLQRGAHLPFVLCAVIDASNATLMSALMIKHSLDDVWLHPKLGHLRCTGAPRIVASANRLAGTPRPAKKSAIDRRVRPSGWPARVAEVAPHFVAHSAEVVLISYASTGSKTANSRRGPSAKPPWHQMALSIRHTHHAVETDSARTPR